MMNRRKLITGMMGALMLPAQAVLAQDASADILAQLKAQGFTDVKVESTWLGRLRILATRADGQREIIVNPRTGEILRDVWTGANGSSRAAILDDVGGGSNGSGSGGKGGGSDDGSGGGSSDGGSGSDSGGDSGGDSGSGSGGDSGGGSGDDSSGGSGGNSGSGNSGSDHSGDDSSDDGSDDHGSEHD